jgi:FKBP-type peptidyl-prolyl cis-trans isomerase FkpA
MTVLGQTHSRGRRTLVALMALLVAGCSSPTQPSVPYSQVDLVVGTGAQAFIGSTLAVDYTGWLYDSSKPDQKGSQFDTSIGANPIVFVLGAGQVIAGWDQGLPGMRVGGQRRLIIPPILAYGASGAYNGKVPPNSTLVFDIALRGVG